MHKNFHLGQRRAADSSHTQVRSPGAGKVLAMDFVSHDKMQLIREVATNSLICAKLSEIASVVKVPFKQSLYTPTTAALTHVQLSPSGTCELTLTVLKLWFRTHTCLEEHLTGI